MTAAETERIVQVTLGIPRVDIKQTRRAVYAYLAVYRRYKHELDEGFIPHAKPVTPKAGYEKADDPQFIHGQGPRPTANPPMGWDEYREAFVARVDHAVGKLPPYGREVIIRRLLTFARGYRTIHDLPSDAEVRQAMSREGWVGQEAYYAEQKAIAIQMLAEMLRIVVYE